MSSAEPQLQSTEDAVSRREFLRAGGLGMVGLGLTDHAVWGGFLHGDSRRNCILVLMTGGPSQLETFDPKPEASAEYRGTLGAIDTSAPGMFLSETLPHLAQRAHRFSVIRSVQHTVAPIHETGLQLLQTGRLSRKGVRFPHIGNVLAQAGGTASRPISAVWPQPLKNTGVKAYLGQEAAGEEDQVLPQFLEIAGRDAEPARRMYGASRFGELLWQSRLMIEQGFRCVTVNLFDELGSRVTWDAHGDPVSGPATIADCRDLLCPAFDRALSGLLDDLAQRNLLDDTLVLVAGEMGRTPRINPQGGRDHWTKGFSALVAGGGTLGGQIIGGSDDIGAYPVDRPVELAELPATMLHWFGIDSRKLTAVVGKQQLPLIPCSPIHELWGSNPAEQLPSDLVAGHV